MCNVIFLKKIKKGGGRIGSLAKMSNKRMNSLLKKGKIKTKGIYLCFLEKYNQLLYVIKMHIVVYIT